MSFLKHPVLANPGPWIKTVHASKLRRTGYYQLSGPFAQALVDTKSDGSSTRFPRGEMVQLAVQGPQASAGGSGAKPKYWIAPVQGVYTSHYIINNRRYVEHMARERRDLRFFPKKVAHRNGSALKGDTSFAPDLSDAIKQGYVSTICAGLAAGARPDHRLKPGCELLLRDEGPLILVQNGKASINIAEHLPEQDGAPRPIAYPGNEPLCDAVLRLVNYVS